MVVGCCSGGGCGRSDEETEAMEVVSGEIVVEMEVMEEEAMEGVYVGGMLRVVGWFGNGMFCVGNGSGWDGSVGDGGDDDGGIFDVELFLD